ncbi:DNA methyltransferase [Varibaculum cambriense]|nr:DNA methyltransferase [Varibaculum cambriense]
MPELNWVGKDKVITHHLDVPYRVLDRQYSYDEHGQHDGDNGSQNMIIHGDNLEALKALLPKYEGKVDCIYIDPPYNTGNEGWIYNDAVNDPRIKKWLGEVVGKEGEDLSRHDKWLCMMYPRLRLLHRLLARNGLIAVSISDTELSNLGCIMDEIFGPANRLACAPVRSEPSGGKDKTALRTGHEYILFYTKGDQSSLVKEEKTTGKLDLKDSKCRIEKGVSYESGVQLPTDQIDRRCGSPLLHPMVEKYSQSRMTGLTATGVGVLLTQVCQSYWTILRLLTGRKHHTTQGLL